MTPGATDRRDLWCLLLLLAIATIFFADVLFAGSNFYHRDLFIYHFPMKRIVRDAMLSGDVETGKTILRDYIKATVGFEKLGAATGAPPKSLIRMFGPRGNPQAKNLFSVIGYLQKQAGVHLHVARG